MALFKQLADWRAYLFRVGHRGILHIQASDERDALQQLNNILPSLIKAYSSIELDQDVQGVMGIKLRAISAGSSIDWQAETAKALHLNQARASLGQTRQILIYNAFAGLNPNIFAMLAGSVEGGGLVVLLSPNFSSWPYFDDPDYAKLSVSDNHNEEKIAVVRGEEKAEKKDDSQSSSSPSNALPTPSSKKRFLSFFQQHLQSFSEQFPHHYCSLKEGQIELFKPLGETLDGSYCDDWQVSNKHSFSITVAQNSIIESLHHQLEHSRLLSLPVNSGNEGDDISPRFTGGMVTVIEGARGRGKSSCVGEYLSQLMVVDKNLDAQLSIVVTAAHNNALTSLFERFIISYADAQACFKPIDEVVGLNQHLEYPLDVLVVDEAAAISSQQLKLCLGLAKQIIFITTTAGYEGNGRGFSIRFKRHLLENFDESQRQFFSLDQAIRYTESDPVEPLINRCFLLDAQACHLPPETLESIIEEPNSALEQLQMAELSQDELLANPVIFERIFGLLIDAHYQTSADDIRFMLDHPDIVIVVGYFAEALDGNIVTAALLLKEGGFDALTRQSFAEKPRRLRGHILPQQLANTSSEFWLHCNYLRVVRIAVLNEVRQYGLASTLLSYIEKQYSSYMLGASFAYSADVIKFWRSNGFDIMQVGSKAESSTGNVALVVLKHPQKLKNDGANIAEGLNQARDELTCLNQIWQDQRHFVIKDVHQRNLQGLGLDLNLDLELGIETGTEPAPDELNKSLNQGHYLLPAEVYQLKRFCREQMSAFQVETALSSLLIVLSELQFKCLLGGENVDDKAPMNHPVFTQLAIHSLNRLSWLELSHALYAVYVSGEPRQLVESSLGISGKKTWQRVCRAYCTMALSMEYQ